MYVKLPKGFYIPRWQYNPDWAIAFHQKRGQTFYFVAETKGSMSTLQLRDIEQAKIHCAKEHFRTISDANVVFDVIDSYKALLQVVNQ